MSMSVLMSISRMLFGIYATRRITNSSWMNLSSLIQANVHLAPTGPIPLPNVSLFPLTSLSPSNFAPNFFPIPLSLDSDLHCLGP